MLRNSNRYPLKRFISGVLFVALLSQPFTATSYAWNSSANGAEKTTHPELVEQGYKILLNDLSERDKNSPEFMAVINDFGTYMADLRQGAIAPDYNDKLYTLYQDHFYDPKTRENFTSINSSLSTTVLDYVFFNAMHRSKDQVAVALNQYKRGMPKAAIYTFGKAMHYYSDVCQPHHASNAIGGTEEPSTKHSAFETFADQIMQNNKLQTLGATTDQPIYQNVLQPNYISDYIQMDGDQNGMFAQTVYQTTFSAKDASTWSASAKETLNLNQKAIAKMIYRFAKEITNPLSESTRIYDGSVNLTVRVKTSSGSITKCYGTDNDVFFGVELKSGKIEEWQLGTSGYNDFENGDNDEYVVCLKESNSSDIRKVWIRKQRGWEAESFEDNWHVAEVAVRSDDGQLNLLVPLNKWFIGNTKTDLK